MSTRPSATSRRRTPAYPERIASLRLFGLADAPETRWLHLVLLEKQLASVEVVAVNPQRPPPDLLTLNPSLRLPMLIDRETAVVTASIIAAYLDERFPHPTLMPSDPAERARVRLLIDQIVTQAFPARTAAQRRGVLIDLADLIGRRGGLLGLDHHLADCAAAVWLLPLTADIDLLPASAADNLRTYVTRLRARRAVQSLP